MQVISKHILSKQRLNFYYYLNEQKVMDPYIICDRDERGAIYTDIAQIHFIELAGVEQLMKKDKKKLSKKDRWRIYLKYSHNQKYQKQISEIIEEEEDLQMIENAMVQALKDGTFMTFIAPRIEAYCEAIDLRAVEEEKRKASEEKRKASEERKGREYAEKIIALMEKGKSRKEAETILKNSHLEL